MPMDANPNPPVSVVRAAEESAPAIDPMEIVRFIVGAARRNLTTCVVFGVLVGMLGLAVVSAIPRRYESTSKIYASSSGNLTSQLTSGRRSLGDESALKDIYESVYTYQNVKSLVHDARLVENWPATRNWFQRMVDRVRVALRGPVPADEMEQQLLPMLQNLIAVRTEDNASIRFHVQWRDPGAAQKLTQLVQRNYLAAKENEELSAISRATTVLEEELRQADAAFTPAVTELRDEIAKLREQNRAKLAPPTPQPTAAAATAPVLAAAATIVRSSAPPIELTAKLEQLRNDERAALEPWQHRNADLKFQLADLKAVYGPAHPAVVTLENKLKAASAEPIELVEIRDREAELKASIASWAVTGHATTTGVHVPGAAPGSHVAVEQDLLRELVANTADDPRLAPARIQLESVLRKSQDMKSRLDAARMELAIAQVGFKYRYREIEPARFWSKPISPKYPMLYFGVAMAALILGFLAGVGRELISGRVMEAWQLKQLGVEVIAEVDVGGWRRNG